MRIAVYTIALNESKFVERWAHSTRHADHRFVADTGSTDDTFQKLIEHGIYADTIRIKPWRFDDARNAALALLPDDIDVCISLDMDELLVEDWRDKIEAVWTPTTTRLKYGYRWSNECQFLSDKIHGRFTHRWKHPCHEIVTPTVPEAISVTYDLVINHEPDRDKPRTQYLSLLELAKKEDIADDRTSHYLGREYYYHGRYHEAIVELQRHLSLPRATWNSERAASMRYIARCFESIDRVDMARDWYQRAVLEEPSRESLVEYARFSLKQGRHYLVIDLCEQALRTEPTSSYIADRYASNEGPRDLLSIAYFQIGDHGKAAEMIRSLAT